MFGHDDKNQQSTEEHMTGTAGDIVQPISSTPPQDGVMGVTPVSTPDPAPAPAKSDDADNDDDIDKIVDEINSADDTTSVPAVPESNEPATKEPEATPQESSEEPTLNETPAELQEVKKSALQELSPLLDELDQPPEEKLNILMMTIQATDDQALLPQALETAKKIEDKKARADAMLDIIQEVNYFTKKQ